MDESILAANPVENLIKFCPTKQEMELLMNYTGAREMLDKCEQFFLELMKVPHVGSKLQDCLSKIQFDIQLSDLKKSSNTVNSACDEVQSSVKSKEVKHLGNTLNQGTTTVGFKLDSLLKPPPPPPPPPPTHGPPPLPPPHPLRGAPSPPLPPPPPPPPQVLKRTAAAPPRSKLKPFHWGKVYRASQGSLWEELQTPGDLQSSAIEIDVSELAKLFSAIHPKKDTSKGGECHMSTPFKFKKLHVHLQAADLAMEESILDADKAETLIQLCPTKKELELLMNYRGDMNLLDKCEQFFLELMKVPCVGSKLQVCLLKIQFDTKLSKFKKSLNTVSSACDEVRTSVKLKEIVKRIMHLGNTLNQGIARGSAVGFKIDTLLRLSDTRASNSKMTLMHYLCKVLANKSPAYIDFHVDLVNLESATKIRLKSLAEEMQSIIKGLEKFKHELAACANNVPEVFHKKLNEIISIAESEVASVTNLYSVMGRNAGELALYVSEAFGENHVRSFEQVTQTLLKFLRLFRKAHEENCNQMEKAKGIY